MSSMSLCSYQMPLASYFDLYSLSNKIHILDGQLYEASRVLLVVNLLEDVLESAVVELEDGVLGAHVQRVAAVQGKLE